MVSQHFFCVILIVIGGGGGGGGAGGWENCMKKFMHSKQQIQQHETVPFKNAAQQIGDKKIHAA